MHSQSDYELDIERRREGIKKPECAEFNINVEKLDGGTYMDHPDVHIKNEPKFIDHAHPHHYPMMHGGCNDGLFGGGGGIGGGLLLGALLGGGLGGFGRNHGNDGNCERAVFDASILSKLGTIEGQVPLVGSQTQTAVATSTGVINTNALQIALSSQQQLSAVAFATQAQLAGVKDAVQTGTFATAIALRDDGDKTRALITANESAQLNRQLGVLETTLLLERHNTARVKDFGDLTIQNVNTNTAVAMQQQQQGQFNARLLDMLHGCNQEIRATNQAINIGAGTQTANPLNTQTNNRVN